jgi:hypothetical protein
MPVIRMPNGQLVRVPDNPSPKEVAQLRLMAGPIEPDPVPDNAPMRFLHGLDVAAGDIQTGVKQRLGQVSDAEVEIRKAETQALRDTPAGSAGHFTGKTIAPALVGMALPGGQSLVPAMATQAALGGMQGLVEPTGIGESALENTLFGAGGGALGGAMGHTLARMVTPSPDPNFVAKMVKARNAKGQFAQGTQAMPRTGPNLLERVQEIPHQYGGMKLAEALNPLVSPVAAAGMTGVGSFMTTGDPGQAARNAAIAGGASLASRKILGNPMVNRYYYNGLFGPRLDMAPMLDPLMGQAAAQAAIRGNME